MLGDPPPPAPSQTPCRRSKEADSGAHQGGGGGLENGLDSPPPPSQPNFLPPPETMVSPSHQRSGDVWRLLVVCSALGQGSHVAQPRGRAGNEAQAQGPAPARGPVPTPTPTQSPSGPPVRTPRGLELNGTNLVPSDVPGGGGGI